MTTRQDILGRPPKRRPVREAEESQIEPIEVLAAPLSAKVMPRRCTFSSGGGMMTETRALASARKTKYRPQRNAPK